MSALWNNALDLYRQTTGEDWRIPGSKFHDLYLNLEMCDSDESSILQALDAEAQGQGLGLKAKWHALHKVEQG